MAVAILAGLFVLLVAGLAVAVSMAVQARRELEDRDEQFAEARDSPIYGQPLPAPWSSFDLDGLRDDVTDVDGHDPFATLIWADSPVSWHAASDSNPSEPKPTTYAAPGADLEPPADLTPVSSLRPLASRATADAPVIVFVVGAGFLGTGTTAGVTTAARLRRAWVEINDSFAQSGVTTFDPDAEPAARPSDDPGAARDPVIVDEEPIWPRVRRRDGDPFSTREEDDSRTSSPPRSNASGPKPTADPEPIKWRAPAEPARRRGSSPRTPRQGDRRSASVPQLGLLDTAPRSFAPRVTAPNATSTSESTGLRVPHRSPRRTRRPRRESAAPRRKT